MITHTICIWRGKLFQFRSSFRTNIFLFCFDDNVVQSDKNSNCFGLCCAVKSTCVRFISKFLIRKRFQPKRFLKNYKKIKMKMKKFINQNFRPFSEMFRNFSCSLSLSHMLFSCKTKSKSFIWMEKFVNEGCQLTSFTTGSISPSEWCCFVLRLLF